jgi:signal peptidase I
MISLICLITIWIATTVIHALAVRWPVRKQEDKPSVWRCVIFVLVVSLAALAFQWIMNHSATVDLSETLVINGVGLIIFLAVCLAIMQVMFRVRGRKMWACFGCFLLANIVTTTFAFGVMKPYLIEAFVVPTPSMAPAIDANDRFLVNKVSHPRRWDIVTFVSPNQERRTVWIKRVVGLPGESLMMKDGSIFIDGQRQTPPSGINIFYTSKLDRRTALTLQLNDGESIVLGKYECFVIGDNVLNSYDSRFFGPLKCSAIIGIADLTYWPLSHIKLLR